MRGIFMHKLLYILTEGLESKTKQLIQRRYEALMSGVLFEQKRNSANFRTALDGGWSIGKIEILCCLNSFYQIVLGPVASISAGGSENCILNEHSIKFGNVLTITNVDAASAHDCHQDFKRLVGELRINYWCLLANHAQDLLYHLTRVDEGPHE